MMFEDNEWTVDVTIKINGIAEYDLSGKHESLSDAIASARREVNKQKYNENRSANDAARYGLSY